MIALAMGGCSDDDGGSGGSAGAGGAAGSGGTGGGAGGSDPGGFAFIRGEEGSELTLRRPDGTEESIGGDTIFGWSNGQLLEGNYYKQLRIGTDIGTMDLRLSFPGDAPPTGLIEGVHELRGTRLLLEDTQVIEEVQVEVFFQTSDPPFDGLTNATGTVEIYLDVNAGLGLYDIAGEIRAEISGEGGTYVLDGYFWAETIDP